MRLSRTYCRLVIDDLLPWKEELVKVADRLEAKTKQYRWTDRTDYLIERDFVVGAYAMRRLVESHSSDTTRQRQFPVRRFDSGSRVPLAPGDISESYDFGQSRRDRLSIVELCYVILHNSRLTFYCGETTDLFDGIYVSSDCHETNCVYLVLASDFIALCLEIGA